MTEAPTLTEDRAAQRLLMLRELGEIGMGLARRIGRQAEEPEADATDLGMVFSRVARAVRQTLALEARLEADGVAQARQVEARRTEETLRRGARKRRQVSDIVEHAIEAETEGTERDDLLDDLYERLADNDDDAAFADTPIAEIIARICRDLGVTPPQDVWDEHLLSPTRSERGEGRERGDAGVASSAPGPAMTHDPWDVAQPTGEADNPEPPLSLPSPLSLRGGRGGDDLEPHPPP